MKLSSSMLLNNCRSLRNRSALILMVALLSFVSAKATIMTWTNTAGGEWEVAANWSPNQVPNTNDSAIITNNGTYQVTLGAGYNYGVSNLTLGGASGTLTFDDAGEMTLMGAGVGNTNVFFENAAPSAFSAGQIYGTGTLILAGPMSFEGNTVGAACYLKTLQSAGGTVQNANWGSGTWINTGTLTMSDGPALESAAAIFSNTPNATVIMTDIYVNQTNGFIGSGTFYNAGTFNVSEPDGVIYMEVNFINSGSVTIGGKTYFSLLEGGTNTGSITISGNNTLACSNFFNTASYEFAPGSTVSGTGNFANSALNLYLDGTVACSGFQQYGTAQITGAINAVNSQFGNFYGATGATTFTNGASFSGVMTVNGTVNFVGTGLIQPSTLTMANGVITGTDWVNAGTLNWSAGTLSGLERCNGGTISGYFYGSQCLLLGGVLLNTGNLVVQSTFTQPYVSEFVVGNNAVLTNAPGAQINFLGNQCGTSPSGAGGFSFYNAGLITCTNTGVFGNPGSQGIMNLDGLINSGTLLVVSNIALNLENGTTNYGQIMAADTSPVSLTGAAGFAPGSLLTMGNGFTVNDTVGTFAGTVDCGGVANFQSGITTFTGNATFTNTMNVPNNGTLNFDGGGTSIINTLNIIGGTVDVTNVCTVNVLGGVNLSNGSLNLNGSGAINSGAMTLTGGNETGFQLLRLSGPLTWTNFGSISGVISANGGSVNVPASAALYDGGQLDNTGTLAWTPNSGPRTGQGSVISNTISGVINVVLNGNNLESYAYGGTSAFYNAGQMNVSGAGQAGWITDPFYNTGTVTISSGTFSISNGGTNNGTITAAAGADFDLSGGTFTSPAGSLVAGAGSFSDSGFGTYTFAGAFNLGGTWNFSAYATVNLAGSTTVSGNTNNLSNNAIVNYNGTGNGGSWRPAIVTLTDGATLGGTTPLQVSGQLLWTGGSIISNTLSFNGGSINASGSSGLSYGGQLDNTGTLAWTPDSGPRTGQGSVISNAPSGVINVVLNGNNLESYAFGGTSAFYNAGQINVSGAGQAGWITDPFYNSGTVTISSGTFSISNGGTNYGTITAAAGADFDLSGGTFTSPAGSLVAGAGSFSDSGFGTYTFAGAFNLGGTWNFSAYATVNLAGSTTVSGNTNNLSNNAIVNYNGMGNGGSWRPAIVTLTDGATLGGNTPLQVSGQLLWTGGSIISNTLSFNGGSINAPGSSGLSYGGQLDNTGTLAWTPDSGPRTGVGSVISNAPSGVINVVLNGNNLETYAFGGTSAFYNAGQINVSGAGQTGAITDPFYNTGTVTISSGTFSFSNGGTNYGTITAAAGADFDLPGGTFTSMASALISGAGSLSAGGFGNYTFAGPLNLSGTWNFSTYATVNLNGSTTVSGNTNNLFNSVVVNYNGTGNGGSWRPAIVTLTDGATLAGTTPLQVSGQLLWTGGSIVNNTLNINGGSINVPGSSALSYGGQLDNTGILAWTPNSGPRTGQGSVISNAPSGVINAVLNGNSLQYYAYGGASAFYNAGQINVSGAGQSGAITDPFYNTGTVTISSGTFSIAGGGTNYSTITAATGADFDLPGGTFTSTAGSLISGAGSLSAGGFGNYTFAGPLNLSGTWNFSTYATVNLAGSTTVSGNTNNLFNSVAVNYNGTGNGGSWRPAIVDLADSATLAGTTPLQVSGPLLWTGGSIVNNTVSINGGSINVSGSSSLTSGGQLDNTGTLMWTPNTGPRTGTGSVISNTVSGVINVALNGNSLESYAYGGASAFYNAGQINLSGAGQAGAITDPFYNSGTVNINSGSLALTHGVSLTNGTFNFGISNTTSYGSLNISGPVGLTGSLGVTFNGYTPQLNDSFGLVSYDSETGAFTSYNLPGSVTWQKTYGATVFSLAVSTFVTGPTNITLLGARPPITSAGFNFLVSGPVGSNYVVQVATNLSGASWQPLTNYVSTVGTVIVTDTNVTKASLPRFYRAFSH